MKLALLIISDHINLQNIHKYLAEFKLIKYDQISNANDQVVIHLTHDECDKILQIVSILKLNDYVIKSLIIQNELQIDNYKSILTQLKCYEVDNVVVDKLSLTNVDFMKLVIQKLISYRNTTVNTSSTNVTTKNVKRIEMAPPRTNNDTNDLRKNKSGRERHNGHLIGKYLQSPPMLFSRDSHPLWMGDVYRGSSAFLILGGPSFSNIDKSKLSKPGILTMGVNNSVKSFRPNLWICVDDPTHFIKSTWLDPKITKFVPFSHSEKPIFDNESWKELTTKVGDCPSVFFYKRNERFVADQFLFEDTINWGNHKDYGGGRSVMLAAIRMLFYLGIRTIYLLGCDFNMNEQSKYHFEQDRTTSSIKGNLSTYKLLADRFKELKPIFEENGLEIFNCNSNSNLKVFPFIELDEAIKLASSELPADIVNERSAGLYDRISKEKEKEKKEKKEKKNKENK